MKTVLDRGKAWFHQERNRLQLFKYRLWQGNYQTLAERQISPHLRDAKLIFWFACVFCVTSMHWGASAFERSGAVLVVAGVFLEQKISKARLAVTLIQSGVISPRGFLGSAHLPGQFSGEWNNECVKGIPVSFWLMGRENLMLRLEGQMNWLLIAGTIVWGYGSVIVGKFLSLN